MIQYLDTLVGVVDFGDEVIAKRVPRHDWLARLGDPTISTKFNTILAWQTFLQHNHGESTLLTLTDDRLIVVLEKETKFPCPHDTLD